MEAGADVNECRKEKHNLHETCRAKIVVMEEAGADVDALAKKRNKNRHEAHVCKSFCVLRDWSRCQRVSCLKRTRSQNMQMVCFGWRLEQM